MCSIDKSIDCRSQKYIVCWVGISYFGMHSALKLKKGTFFLQGSPYILKGKMAQLNQEAI